MKYHRSWLIIVIIFLLANPLRADECTDSDGGENYFMYGECTDMYGNVKKDECYNGKLYEVYCAGYGLCGSSTYLYDCPSGYECRNGACKPVTTTTTVLKCSDGTKNGQCSINKPLYCDSPILVNRPSMCGCPTGYGDCNSDDWDGCEVNLNTDNSNCGWCGNACGTGYECKNSNCIAKATCDQKCREEHTAVEAHGTCAYSKPADFCINSYTAGRYWITETGTSCTKTCYCYFEQPCTGAGESCESGACVVTTTTIPAYCTDTDGGENYYVYGECTDSRGAFKQDTCYNGKLYEYYCSNKECTSSFYGYTCPTGYTCQNGACKPQATTTTAPATTNLLNIKWNSIQ